MYDIKLQKDKDYVNCWYYKSKNEYNQIIVLEIFEIKDEPNYMNVTFYITTKRKDGFQHNKVTGKDGVKSFIWAKRCLFDFISEPPYSAKGKTLLIYPDSNRLRTIYERTLIPLGFKVAKTKDKQLYLKLMAK